MSRVRRLCTWTMGAAVLGWLTGCGAQPAASPPEAVPEAVSEPLPVSPAEPAPVDLGTPGDVPPAQTEEPVEPPPDRLPVRLCGPASRPCTVQLQEELPFVLLTGSTPLSSTLVLDGEQRPHVFGSSGEYNPLTGGVLAERSSSGGWAVQQLPPDWTHADFTLSSEDEPLVTRQTSEQAEPLSVWRRASGGWQLQASVGMRGVPFAFKTDMQGKLHALLRTQEEPFRLVYGSEADGWVPHSLGMGGGVILSPGFTLSPRSGAHIAYWEEVNDHWTLTWQSASSLPERLLSLPTSGNEGAGEYVLQLRMALTETGGRAGSETSHLFFGLSRPELPVSLRYNEIAYASRVGQGAWTVQPVFQDTALTPRCDLTPPAGPGLRCEVELLRHEPGPVVNTRQELRFFIRWIRIRVQMGSWCRGDTCKWVREEQTDTYGHKMLWVDAGQVQTVDLDQVPGNFAITSAQADSRGRLHLIFRGDDSYPAKWRYVLLGASGPEAPPSIP